MKSYKKVFRRIEKKYIVDGSVYPELRRRLTSLAAGDEYGMTSVNNIYYDTPDHKLIRTSLEKPVFKEKLRVRSYGVPGEDDSVFIEIKRKFDGIVYKRRIDLPYHAAEGYLSAGCHSCSGNPEPIARHEGLFRPDLRPGSDRQIMREIDYFLDYYKNLAPRMALSYDRIALIGLDDPDLRITFDDNIRWRSDRLDLAFGNTGTPLLEPGNRLMEIKFTGAVPVELTRILSELGIFPASFSKYGRAYLQMISVSGSVKGGAKVA
jgi:hypothetical protein